MRKGFFIWFIVFLGLLRGAAIGADAWVLNAILNGGAGDLAPYIHSCCDGTCTGATNCVERVLEETGYWGDATNHDHWFIIDLGAEYYISAVRGRSAMARDPDNIDIHTATEFEGPSFVNYTDAFLNWNPEDTDPADYEATSGTHYQALYQTVRARYVRVWVDSTENATDYLYWGPPGGVDGAWTDTDPANMPGFDVYGSPVNAVKSTIFSPTNTIIGNWTVSTTGNGHDLVEYMGDGVTDYIYAITNITERLRWTVTPTGSILGVRMWWRGKDRSGSYRRCYPQYFEVDNYGAYGDYNFQFDPTWRYYYHEMVTDPSDGGAWTAADFTAGWDGEMKGLSTEMPGGSIAEWFLQVISSFDTNQTAYCNIAPWCGGETDDELIVKARTTGAAKVRFAWATTQGPLLYTTDPESPETGVTVEADPASDNAVAANDFVHTARITGLDANTTYYFTAFVDGFPAHVVERANVMKGSATSTPAEPYEDRLSDNEERFSTDEFDGYTLVMCSGAAEGDTFTIDDTTAATLQCAGDDLAAAGVVSGDKYCIAAPESMWFPLNHWKTAGTQGTSQTHTNIYLGDMHSYVRDDNLYHSAAAAGADGVILLGDNHAENSQAYERASWDSSAGVVEGYRRLVFGYAVPARHFSYEILKDHVVRAATPSDHDWGGNNVDKIGLLSTNIFSGGGYNDTDFIRAYVTFNDSPSTIVVNPDYGDDINVTEDNILIRVTGGVNEGTYQADLSSIVGDTYTFSVTPTPDDETDAVCKVEFIKGRTWKCREAYDLYMPNRIDPDGDGLGDEITAGGTRRLPLPADDITGTASGGGITFLTDTDMNPVMFNVDNVSGTFTEGESVTWDSAAGTGKLIYWDSANAVMVVYWTAIATLADNDTITNGTATATVNDVTNNGRNWPTVGTFGVYPGRIVYHMPESTSDYSLAGVDYIDNSVSPARIYFFDDLFATEVFGAGDEYRIQVATINQRNYHGADVYLTLDLRALRDGPVASIANPGGDWLDGTKDGISQKIEDDADGASTDTDTIHCTACDFTSDADPFGRLIAVGDLVLVDTDNDSVWTDETANYALVESFNNTTKLIELDRAITGLSQNDGFKVQECGGSDHGSRVANINAGHVMREWLIDCLTPIAEGGSKPTWAKWSNIIAEQPFHDVILGSGSYDKPGDFDPLDALYDYVKNNVTVMLTTWTGADRHYSALYDGIDSINPFPSMNCSPAFADVATGVPWQNHELGEEWTVRVGEGVFRFCGWGLDNAKDDGYYINNVPRNGGSFGVQVVTSSTITATLYDTAGAVLSNDSFAAGETGDVSIVSVTDNSPSAGFSRVTVAASTFTEDEHNGKILRVITCADNANTVNNEYVVYDTGTNYVDVKVADLKAGAGLDTDDTFQVREKMWLGIEAYTDARSIGDMTCQWSRSTYTKMNERAFNRGFADGFQEGF